MSKKTAQATMAESPPSRIFTKELEKSSSTAP